MSSNTNFATSGILGANFDTPTTNAEFALGTRTVGKNGSTWVYVQADGIIAIYDWVGIDENWQAGALTKAMADDGWTIGVAQVAFTDNQYGWVAIQGHNLNANVLTAAAADVSLYTSGTAGSLDDESTSQTKIDGVVLTVTDTTAATYVPAILTFPRASTF